MDNISKEGLFSGDVKFAELKTMSPRKTYIKNEPSLR